MLVDGSCVNSKQCKDLVTCCAIEQQWTNMTAAYASPEFSSASAYFYPGKHTVLLRVQNAVSGFSSAAAACRLDPGGLRSGPALAGCIMPSGPCESPPACWGDASWHLRSWLHACVSV
jgi:hypothetical protein